MFPFGASIGILVRVPFHHSSLDEKIGKTTRKRKSCRKPTEII